MNSIINVVVPLHFSVAGGGAPCLDDVASGHAGDSLFNLVASGASVEKKTSGAAAQMIAYEACKRLGERDAMRG